MGYDITIVNWFLIIIHLRFEKCIDMVKETRDFRILAHFDGYFGGLRMIINDILYKLQIRYIWMQTILNGSVTHTQHKCLFQKPRVKTQIQPLFGVSMDLISGFYVQRMDVHLSSGKLTLLWTIFIVYMKVGVSSTINGPFPIANC